MKNYLYSEMEWRSPNTQFFLSGKRIEIVLFTLFCAFINQGYGQKSAEEIMALPEEQRLRTLWNWDYPDFLKDTTATVAYFHQLERDFTKMNELILAQQSWIMGVEYITIYRYQYSELGITEITKAIETARSRGWREMEADCIIRKGLLYYKQSQFGPAFEHIQRGYNQLKKLGFEKCPQIIRHLEEIGHCYYEFGDMEEAIQFLREALAQKPVLREAGEKRKTMNTIALCFNALEQYDSAIHYYTLAHHESMIVRDTFWAALANGNKGYVYYLQGKYDEAIPLMETDYEQSLKYHEWPSAANAAMGLATMYLTKGNLEKAQYYLDFAQDNINYWNLRDVSGFYKNLAIISRIKGDYDAAFKAMDSSQYYKDKYAKVKDSRIINQAKLKVEVEHHANQIRLLENARSRQILIRNSLLAILLLSGIIAWLLLHQQRLRRNKERQLAELRQKAAEDELENARKQLTVFTNALKEKNELVESFINEIEILQQSGVEQSDIRTEQINQLLNATILTEEDWKEFRQMFDKVHPGFFIRLKEKMNDLTPAETRLLALTKLQLAPKEMAAMLGISYDAIKKSRQRLRRKINLPEEGSLDELVELI